MSELIVALTIAVVGVGYVIISERRKKIE